MITGYIWRPWTLGREYMTATGWTFLTILAQEFTEDEYKTTYQSHGYGFEPKREQPEEPKTKEGDFLRDWDWRN